MIGRATLPVVGPALGAARYLELMRLDKKVLAGETRFVVLDGPGSAVIRPAPDALIAELVEANTA